MNSIIKDLNGNFSKFIPPFTPFDNSLRKIYGDDFFKDEPDKTPDFDGCILLRDTEIYHGDTDGDIPRIGRYPFIAQDPVKMMEKILDNKRMKKEQEGSD